MDQRKAIFRSKLRESKQQQQQRIDSPLVRYNEFDQPICRVCNLTLKSESLWPAHQVSKKHHEAVENLRASAAGKSRSANVNREQLTEVQKAKSSALPSDFFDSHGTKRPRGDALTDGKGQSSSSEKKEVAPAASRLLEVTDTAENELVTLPTKSRDQTTGNINRTDARSLKGTLQAKFFDKGKSKIPPPEDLSNMAGNTNVSNLQQVKRTVPENFFDSMESDDATPSSLPNQQSKTAKDSETKQVQGALPEGFFDNKEADLRARGIQPVKPDINDAYKEFQKEIQEDLQEVDDRLEEEEIDAAAEQEEFLTMEQRELRERVDMIKKKMIEAKAASVARANQKPPKMMTEESSDDSSSDEDDVNFEVDWRAQHLK